MNTVRAILEYKCYPIVFANTNAILEEFQKVDTDDNVIRENYLEIVEAFDEEVDFIDDLYWAMNAYLDILIRNRYRKIFLEYSHLFMNAFEEYLELDYYRGNWMFDIAIRRAEKMEKEGEGHDK